jgi:hypothetical protein
VRIKRFGVLLGSLRLRAGTARDLAKRGCTFLLRLRQCFYGLATR